VAGVAVPARAEPSNLTGTAAAFVEHMLAVVVVLARLLSLLTLVPVLVGTAVPPARWWPLAAIVAVAAAETAVFAVISLRRRAMSARLALLDMLVTSSTLWPGVLLLPVTAAGRAWSPTYSYLMVAIPVAGLAPWSLPAALGVATIAAGATLGNIAASTEPYPLTWHVTPDVLNPIWDAVIAWVIAASVRAAARQVDEQRRQAVARAGTLARERERIRQTDALRGQLLSTIEDLAADDIADRRVRDQLRAEAAWLRRLVTTGSTDPPADLVEGLGRLAEEKGRAGVRVCFSPGTVPALPAERVQALLGAVREALTNVVKHAGAAQASLAVDVTDGEVRVVVSDAGRGFDPAAVQAGTGSRQSIRQRLAEVGGRAEIDSSPGRGTRVQLWVPV